MTRNAIQDGVDVLAVMGGDGMMHLGVNTTAAAHLAGGSRTTLGLIPAGTGFEYYRHVRIPADEPPPPPPPTPEELELEREMEYFVEPEEAFTRDVDME